MEEEIDFPVKKPILLNSWLPEVLLERFGITEEEFCYLYSRLSRDEYSISKSLLCKGIGKPNKNGELYLTTKDENYVRRILSELIKYNRLTMKRLEIDEKFISLAKQLREMFPKGVRPGCSKHWRSSSIVVAKKLQKLNVEYGISFTNEEALDATKRYVDSFKGEYSYMECLEYFILRQLPSFKSNFIEFLENPDAGEEDSDDFMIQLR